MAKSDRSDQSDLDQSDLDQSDLDQSDLQDASDEDLMERYKKMGDTIAFEHLFNRHSGRVQGYLQQKLSSRKEAQDLLQEVFFKLHRSRHLYNTTLPFSPWLFSITRSIWLDHLKKSNREDVVDHKVLERLVPAVEAVGHSDPGLGRDILDILPMAQKEALALRVYDDATFEEIAAKLSTSPENARQLVSRGLKKLRELFGPRRKTHDK